MPDGPGLAPWLPSCPLLWSPHAQGTGGVHGQHRKGRGAGRRASAAHLASPRCPPACGQDPPAASLSPLRPPPPGARLLLVQRRPLALVTGETREDVSVVPGPSGRGRGGREPHVCGPGRCAGQSGSRQSPRLCPRACARGVACTTFCLVVRPAGQGVLRPSSCSAPRGWSS